MIVTKLKPSLFAVIVQTVDTIVRQSSNKNEKKLTLGFKIGAKNRQKSVKVLK